MDLKSYELYMGGHGKKTELINFVVFLGLSILECLLFGTIGQTITRLMYPFIISQIIPMVIASGFGQVSSKYGCGYKLFHMLSDGYTKYREAFLTRCFLMVIRIFVYSFLTVLLYYIYPTRDLEQVCFMSMLSLIAFSEYPIFVKISVLEIVVASVLLILQVLVLALTLNTSLRFVEIPLSMIVLLFTIWYHLYQSKRIWVNR